MKIDKHDREILYALDLDARQSNARIAKTVGLSRDAIGYRIRRLEGLGLIRGYVAVIDAAKLGYIYYRVYLDLLDTPPDVLEEMINFLKAEKNVWWIAKLDGAWDFVFSIWVRSNHEFRAFYNVRFCTRFRPHIKEAMICPVLAYKQLCRNYILEHREVELVESVGGGEIAEHDRKDLRILRILSQDARAPLLGIAQKLKVDSMTVLHRIRKLENVGIIQGYKADINFGLLGRDFYSVKIDVRTTGQLKQLEHYVKSIKETTAIIEAVGSYDFEFDLEVEGTERYFTIIEDLQDRFDSIRDLTYFRVLKNYKVSYMPEV